MEGSSSNNVTIIDDKSPICIPFIIERLREYQSASGSGSGSDENAAAAAEKKKPFIIGLNGVQGVGKTTLVSALAAKLRDEGLETLVCSIDDFYLTHEDQKALAASHPDNQLVQVRGEPASCATRTRRTMFLVLRQCNATGVLTCTSSLPLSPRPGTHDMALAQRFFAALCAGEPARVPRYDKSAHGGAGDRAGPESAWQAVNEPGARPVQVVIFEGWCVGFRRLGAAGVAEKRRAAGASSTLRRHAPEHLQLVDERLGAYDAVTDLFDAFIHIDAEDTRYVYDWRLEQEAKLRKEKGAGMTDEQVVRFVDAYYPAYELFSDKLREGLFPDKPGRQLRLVVGKDRKVKQTIVI